MATHLTAHPVDFHVEHPARMQRVHVVIRIALLLALGAVGCSSLYWLLYLSVPAFAALLISQSGSARYLAEDAPEIMQVVRWIAGAYAYLWLLTDAAPSSESGGPVELRVESGGAPTPGSAMLRLLYAVPAVLVLAVLSMAAAVLWPIGAIAILVRRRVPGAIADFLTLTLRYQFRLVAYHLSLVEAYPSFDVAAAQAPHSNAA